MKRGVGDRDVISAGELGLRDKERLDTFLGIFLESELWTQISKDITRCVDPRPPGCINNVQKKENFYCG